MKWKVSLFVLSLIGFTTVVMAETQSDEDWKKEMERKIEILTQEVEKKKLGEVAKPVYESKHGLGVAASKVYHVNQGVSIGGYGEMVYQNFQGSKDDGTPSNKKDQLDFLRAILYFGYKFTDKIIFNSEIEFEHATTANQGSRGEVSVEFAYLDFLWNPVASGRAGMVLIPVGWVNELHEPTLFYGVNRPNVERYIIPTTWRENGAGLFGDWGMLTYRTYVVAGLQGVEGSDDFGGFSASGSIRNARSKGSKSQAEDLAWVGRLDAEPLPGTILGVSAYRGGSGQGTVDANNQEIDGTVTLWDIHAEAQYRGLHLRGLYVETTIDDVAALNAAQPTPLTGSDSIGEEAFGGYAEIAFDVLSLFGSRQSLSPYYRYERYDTQKKVPTGFSRNPANSRVEHTFGLAYKPHPNVVFKGDIQNKDNQAGTGIDQANLSMGYVF